MPSLTLLALIFLVAMVYSSVGHGGASGYLAVLSLLGSSSPAAMSTSALMLNLLVAAARLCLPALRGGTRCQAPPLAVALPAGGALGVMPGILGVGGGIFLSPLMALLRWADVKRVAAISAAFIVVNSLAGLAGRLIARRLLIDTVVPPVAAAFAGGVLGSRLGANHVSGAWLRRLLALVPVLAAGKLVAAHG